MANAHAASEVNVEGDDNLADVDAADTEAFWLLQNAIGDISAPSPSYTDACQIFDQSPEGPTVNSLLLKPWQAIEVA